MSFDNIMSFTCWSLVVCLTEREELAKLQNSRMLQVVIPNEAIRWSGLQGKQASLSLSWFPDQFKGLD